MYKTFKRRQSHDKDNMSPRPLPTARSAKGRGRAGIAILIISDNSDTNIDSNQYFGSE